jgi:hypothetical protein
LHCIALHGFGSAFFDAASSASADCFVMVSGEIIKGSQGSIDFVLVGAGKQRPSFIG